MKRLTSRSGLIWMLISLVLITVIVFVYRMQGRQEPVLIRFDYLPVKAQDDGKISLLDPAGKIVLPDEFRNNSDVYCTDGIITERVSAEPSYTRYFRFDGKKLQEISTRKYRRGSVFIHGYAIVSDEDGLVYLLDKKGRETALQSVDGIAISRAGMVSDGLIRVMTRQGEWGYISPQGKWIIRPAYKVAESFIEGKARVITPAGELLVINRKGEILMKGKEGFTYQPVSEDLIGYSESAGSGSTYFGFMNLRHEKVIRDNKYTNVTPFYNGFSVVTGEDDLFGVIDKKGEIVGDLRTKFKEKPLIRKSGFAVMDDDKLKLYDRSGNQTITIGDYENVYPVNDDLLLVKLRRKKKYELIDMEGRVLTSESYYIDLSPRLFTTSPEMFKSGSIESTWVNFEAISTVALNGLSFSGIHGLTRNSRLSHVQNVFSRLEKSGTTEKIAQTGLEDAYSFLLQPESRKSKEPLSADALTDSMAENSTEEMPAADTTATDFKDPYPEIVAYAYDLESGNFYAGGMQFSAEAMFDQQLKTGKYEWVTDSYWGTTSYRQTGYVLNEQAKLKSVLINFRYGQVNSDLFTAKLEKKLEKEGWIKDEDGYYNKQNNNRIETGYGYLLFRFEE